MNTRPRRKGSPISEKEKQWARILFRRGLTFKEIAAKTGIAQGEIHRLSIDGAWKEDNTPYHTPHDVLSLLDEHVFELLLMLRNGEVEDESRLILDVKNLSATKRDVEELILAVDDRALVLALEKHMVWLGKHHPEASDALEAAQRHHDEVVKTL